MTPELRGVLRGPLLASGFATSLAAWFLEIPLRPACIGVALAGWLLHIAPRRARIWPREADICEAGSTSGMLRCIARTLLTFAGTIRAAHATTDPAPIQTWHKSNGSHQLVAFASPK